MRNLKLRSILLRVLPQIHTTLILSPYCAIVSAFAAGVSTDRFFPLYLLLFVPIALISYVTVKIKNLWIYLALCCGICGGVYFIFSSWPVLVLMGIFIVIKISGRLSGNSTIFDSLHPAGLGAFVLPFVYSAYVKDEKFQLAMLCTAMVYLALTFLYRGIKRVGEYIEINEKMYNFPGKRIGNGGLVIFSATAAVILLMTIPAIVSNFSMTEIIPADRGEIYEPTDISGADSMAIMPEKPEWMKAAENVKPLMDLSFLSDLLIYMGIGAFILLLGYGIYKLTQSFGSTVREKNDVIESMRDSDDRKKITDAVDRMGVFDFSPNAYIRKRYKKRVKASKKPLPLSWQSPKEIEGERGGSFGELHVLYEKARYSEGGCTQEDRRKQE